MEEFQRSLLKFLAFLTVLIERTGAARDRLGADGGGTCRSQVRTTAPGRLLQQKFAVETGGGAPTTTRKEKEERSLSTNLDIVQGVLLSCQFIIPSCEV